MKANSVQLIKAIIYNPRNGLFLIHVKKNEISYPQIDSFVNYLSSIKQFQIDVERLIQTKLGFPVKYWYIAKLENTEICLVFTTDYSGESDTPEYKWVNIDQAKELTETFSSIIKVYDRFQKYSFLLSESQNIQKTALAFLFQKLVKNDSFLGWPQYLGVHKVGLVGTALGILCYCHAGRYSPIIYEGVKTLKHYQNEDGGWPLYSTGGIGSTSITESTATILWALLEAGLDVKDETIIRAFRWLEEAQRPSGGWASSKVSVREKTFPTAFATRLFSRINARSDVAQQAVIWLRNSQQVDGGWGALSPSDGYLSESDAAHTAHALLALSSAEVNTHSDFIQRGIRWILDNYSENIDDGWDDRSEVEYVDENNRLEYRHYSAPWCVAALISTGVPIFSNEVLLKTSFTLMKKQHVLGYWTQNLAPGQFPIWAIHDNLFLSRLISSSVQLEMGNQNQAILKQEQEVLYRYIFRDNHNSSGNRSRVNYRLLVTWNLIISGIIVALMIGNQQFVSFFSSLSIVGKIMSLVSPILIALGAGFIPFFYQLLWEEYKLRREAAIKAKK